jgi:TRAP-type C4-dicarboxylate transport system permease large subunit
VGNTSIAKLTPSLVPFIAAMVLALLVITFWPGLVLLVPGWFGHLLGKHNPYTCS